MDNRQTAECVNCHQPITRAAADSWLAAAANRPVRHTDWVDGGDSPYCAGGTWVKHRPDSATLVAPQQ